MDNNVPSMWEHASCIDPALRVTEKEMRALLKKRVCPVPYSRACLFKRMAEGEVSVFSDFALPITTDSDENKVSFLLDGIERSFSKTRRVELQAGPHSRVNTLSVPRLISRWKRGRAIVSVTDLHFRGTHFEEIVNTSPLSDFNILCNDPKLRLELMNELEMMTLVISSARNVTDNHTDDCDGSNHCFVGKKLWLAWDRMEGRARGFQDVDRDGVVDVAAFSVQEFSSMRSSRWFTVSKNETLFLPGSLTHKVITLQSYIGLGSFHVALPGYVRSLQRWILYDTLDVGPKKLLEKINDAVIRRIERLQKTTSRTKEHWGVREMKRSIALWKKSENRQLKESLLRHPLFVSFYNAAARS